MKAKIIRELLNEKWYDPYHLFKSRNPEHSFQYREKILTNQSYFIDQLIQISEDIGLNVEGTENDYIYAYKEGEDKEKWHFLENRIYYNKEMKDIIENLLNKI